GTQAPDRPIQNTVAEFNRKFSEMSRQNTEMRRTQEAILSYLQAQQQPSPPSSSTQQRGPVSDEQLWQAAQQGDREAFVVHQQRVAQGVYNQNAAAERRAKIVNDQIMALYGAYPSIADGSTPLGDTANRAYRLLLQNGYPQNHETMLDAMKTA